MAGWFEIKKASNGQFHFTLKAGNGETILSSELYVAKSSAVAGIESVRANCANDDRYDRAESVQDQPYFTLKAANHQVIGTSQMYSSTSARDAGVESVKVNGQSTEIKDNT